MKNYRIMITDYDTLDVLKDFEGPRETKIKFPRGYYEYFRFYYKSAITVFVLPNKTEKGETSEMEKLWRERMK